MECRTPPMDAIDLARKIHASVSHKLDPNADFSKWTKQLFKSLEGICVAPDHEVYYSGYEGFLLDFTWYKKPTRAIILAVEIEWGNEESRYEPVSYDFEK